MKRQAGARVKRARRGLLIVSASAVGALRQAEPRKLLTAPVISYSMKKTEVDVDELLSLYRAAAQPYLTQGSVQKQRHYGHWTSTADEDRVRKRLQAALDSSVAIAAAFTRDPRIVDPADWQAQLAARRYSGAAAGISGMGAEGAPSDWLLRAWQPKRPRLVGFVRASGDKALVVTLHDLVIHPDAQGFGIGSRLLRNMVTHVSQHLGIYDVGLVTPAELQPFFRSASFDLDREASVPMLLSDRRKAQLLAPGAAHGIAAEVASNAQLAQLLRQRLV